MTVYDWTVTIDGVDVSQFVIAGGTIDSGRSSFFTEFESPRAVFDMHTPLGWPQYSGTWPTIDYDMPVIIHVTWDGTTQWRRFTGKVQAIDLGVYVHRVTCIHEVADLDVKTCADTFYDGVPAGLPLSPEPDKYRIARYADEMDVTINVVGTAGRWVVGIPGNTRGTNALQKILNMAYSCDARLRGTRLGDIDYRLRVWSRPARYTLPATVVERDTIDMSRERGLIRTAVEVTYGVVDEATGSQDYVYVPNTELEPIYGDRRDQITTELLYRVGAEGKGNQFLTDHADLYHAPDVVLIMSRATGAEADAILTLDDDYPVRLTPLPESFPITTYDADVIGFTEIMHQEDYRIILHLSPGSPASDEDDGNWVEDGTITGGDETGTLVEDGRVYRWHKFTSAGPNDLTVTADVVADILVIGGGGPGGRTFSYEGGGGGAGAVYAGTYELSATTGTYAVTVGPGGTGTDNGGHTKFAGLWAYGGGRGGSRSGPAAANGGSGGGADGDGGGSGGIALGGSFDGGATSTTAGFRCHDGGAGAYHLNGGSGGGADAAGAYNGGPAAGYTSDLTGTSVTYAYGGATYNQGTTPATPGSGGDSLFNAYDPGQGGMVFVRYPITPGGGAGAAYVYDEDIPYDTAITYEEA